MNPRNTEKDFWERVDKNGPVPPHMKHLGQCWVWTGKLCPQGYGKFYQNYKRLTAHRYSYEVTYKVAPGKLLVCHHCDNPNCIRPSHLFLGTSSDNARDAVAKGRNKNRKTRKTHCMRGHPFIEGNVYLKSDGGRECKKCMGERYKIRLLNLKGLPIPAELQNFTRKEKE